MEKIYVRNLFRILVPLTINCESALTAITRTEPFGLDIPDRRSSVIIKLVGTDYFGNITHEPKNCFTWAKRNPLVFQQNETNEIIGMFICMKINEGVFDFRRTKYRAFQIIVELVENGSLTKRGTSRLWELLPKRRRVQSEDEENNSKSSQ